MATLIGAMVPGVPGDKHGAVTHQLHINAVPADIATYPEKGKATKGQHASRFVQPSQALAKQSGRIRLLVNFIPV